MAQVLNPVLRRAEMGSLIWRRSFPLAASGGSGNLSKRFFTLESMYFTLGANFEKNGSVLILIIVLGPS